MICYNSSYESFILNLFYNERVNGVLFHVHIREIVVYEEFISLSERFPLWWPVLVRSLLPIFIVSSSFIYYCDVSCGCSSLFLPSLGGWSWLSSRTFLSCEWCSIVVLLVGLSLPVVNTDWWFHCCLIVLLSSSKSGLRSAYSYVVLRRIRAISCFGSLFVLCLYVEFVSTHSWNVWLK